MRNLNSPLVVVDVETSGLNPFRHELLSVTFVPFAADVEPLEVYVKADSIEWSPYARKIFDKYSEDWMLKSTSPDIACEKIEHYLRKVFLGEKATPVGHNVGFDMSFLKRLAFLGGREEIDGLSHRAIDTHTLLYLLCLKGEIPSSALNSDGAFKYFGIQVPEHLRHTATGDAVATKHLVSRLFEEFGVHLVSFNDEAISVSSGRRGI
jgi:DNA polymerase-3 subunit epsilon